MKDLKLVKGFVIFNLLSFFLLTGVGSEYNFNSSCIKHQDQKCITHHSYVEPSDNFRNRLKDFNLLSLFLLMVVDPIYIAIFMWISKP